MFERLHLGYYLLLVLTATAMAAGLAFGEVNLSRFLSPGGIKRLILSASVFPLMWITAVAVAITRRQVDWPAATLLRMIRSRKRWLLRGTFFFVVIVAFARCFSSFKIAIPVLNPFWADPLLAELDHRTFGTDAWVLTHSILGDFGTLVIDRIYILWFVVVALTSGWICFARDPKLQIRGLMCYVLSWTILGGATALGLSSVGPCFYEEFYGSQRFTPLMDKLGAISVQQEIMAFRTMNFLIGSLDKDYIGGGISAMPSLHVAMALLSFLCVYCYTNSKVLKVVSSLFGIAILIGSVHLGWHYAWDGIISIIGVTIFWWATGRYVDWLEARELQQSKASQPAIVSVTALPATP